MYDNSNFQSSVSVATASKRMSNQHLWNLLQGRVVVVADDVVLEELRENVIRLTNALTYYKPYQQEADDGDNDNDKGKQKPIYFPAMPKFIRDDITESRNLDEPSSSSSLTTGSSKREKFDADRNRSGGSKSQLGGMSSFEQLRIAVAQRLDLDINIAEELLITYMMFEYKGCSTTYDTIVDTHRSFLQFLKELSDFYVRERTCLLLCIQSILARVGDEDDPFYNIIESFRSLISTSNWCQGLLDSIPFAKTELELIEILHCLLLLTYKLPEDSIPKFFTYFRLCGFSALRKSEEMKMAEGAVMYSVLLVAGLTDCCSSVIPTPLFSKEMKEFLRKHLDTLLLNPFNIAPVLACYDLLCKDDPELTQKMRRIPCNPSLTFSAMIKLVEKYGRKSLSDRHSISLILSSSVFEGFEVLLANYDSNHFGTKAQAFRILSKILEHSSLAENFMCGSPPALTVLYTEATKLFPIDVASTLLIWKSLCMSVRNKEDCSMLMSGVAKLNCIAEFLDEDNLEVSTMRRIGIVEMLNEKTRTVFGIELERGARGTLNNIDEGDGVGIPYISWELPSSSSSNLNAFSAIRAIIEPMAEELVEMGKVGHSFLENGVDSNFNFDYMPQVIFPVAEFIIHFMQNTDTAIDEVNYLVHPVCIILERMVKLVSDPGERGKLIKYLLGIVEAVNEFSEEKIILFNYLYENLQGRGGDTVMNIIENMILRRESVSSSGCEVTLAFLNLIASFSENEKVWKENQQYHSKFLTSITFISQNILPTLTTWMLGGNEGIRLQIYSKCLQLFTSIFSLEGNSFTRLKRDSLKFLITPNSFLLKLLGTDESLLQTSIINPTLETQLVGKVVCSALKLLHKIIIFEERVLLRLDQLLEGNLVRFLGLFTRHRLNPVVPTVSIMILKEIAEHSNISLLAGFGKDQNAFRDVMLQRLEFIAEDINLKISVLDFLAVASQTQMSIMVSYFKDGVLESNVLELIQQDNEELSLACLNFFRSLFRQNFILTSKAHTGFWIKIMGPVNNHSYSSLTRKTGERFPEIVTATLHILTFELYNNNCNDSQFGTELEQFLKNEKVKLVVEAVLAESNELATKCLVALKQFFLLVLGRAQLFSKLVSLEVLMDVRKRILESFFEECDDGEDETWDHHDKEEYRRRCKTLVELVTILTTGELSSSPQFMGELLLKLLKVFKFLSFGVKLSIFCLLNKCYFLCNQKLVGDGIIENTLRLVRSIWKNSSVNLLDLMGTEENHPILVGAATLLKTIVEKQPYEVWAQAYKQELVALSFLSICCVGIKMEMGPNVVSASLATLIALAEDSQGYILLPSSGMSNSLWLHLHKFTVEGGSVKEWVEVFMLCLNFNSKLLRSLKRDYLDEALAFWGLFSSYLNSKLVMMMSLTEICLKELGTEEVEEDVKAVLRTNTFVLNGILNMMPYLEDWQRSQRAEVFKMIKMVFQVLQEACSLLRQPLLLQSSNSVGFSKGFCRARSPSPSKAEARTTAASTKLVEMQGRLWEICDLCIHILVKLKGKQDEFIEKGVFIPTMLQVGQLCIKTLATAKDSLGISGMNRISSVMEKAMLTVHNFTVPVLEDATRDFKLQIAFRREWSTEVVSLIDGIRRLGIPKNEFLVDICSRMESKFK
ncbi:unnamed protein product [Orchesella dallaii]|uniref:Uncharacterized protein n=1 Tax=Orchesella dallaii TaxID=48710 RepID=A0ABP1S8I4_9HEXA